MLVVVRRGKKRYKDNANRCLLLYVDSSKEQDKAIIDYPARLSAGMINHSGEHAIKVLYRNIQQMLLPVQVVNLHAHYIQLPEQIFMPRRTITLLLSFIETVTFYHQYQREMKRDGQNQSYIVTTPADRTAAWSPFNVDEVQWEGVAKREV